MEFEKWAMCPGICTNVLENVVCSWKIIKTNNPLCFMGCVKKVRNAGYVRARCDIIFRSNMSVGAISYSESVVVPPLSLSVSAGDQSWVWHIPSLECLQKNEKKFVEIV